MSATNPNSVSPLLVWHRQQSAKRSPLVKVPATAPTGITGFDEIIGGGLPRGRTTLLVRGPGSGKTIPALQFLVHGAQDCRESGISGASPASDRQPQ